MKQILVVIFLGLLVLTSANPVFGAGDATLSFNPFIQEAVIGQNYVTNIEIEPQGEDVLGVEIVITFDPSVVQITGIQPGNFFTDSGKDPFIAANYIEEDGLAHLSLIFNFIDGLVTSSVPGTAAIVSYTPIGHGSSELAFKVDTHPKTGITDSEGNDLLGSVSAPMQIVVDASEVPFFSPIQGMMALGLCVGVLVYIKRDALALAR